jgi:hypothetical protein
MAPHENFSLLVESKPLQQIFLNLDKRNGNKLDRDGSEGCKE